MASQDREGQAGQLTFSGLEGDMANIQNINNLGHVTQIDNF